MTPQTAVERFWVQARVEGKLNRLEAVIGQNVQDTVPPPVWSTSPDPAQATRDVEELLGSGTLTQVFAMRTWMTPSRFRPGWGIWASSWTARASRGRWYALPR